MTYRDVRCDKKNIGCLESSLQFCHVLGVALVEEVHADPDRLPRDDIEGGGLDLGVAEHHLGLRVIRVKFWCLILFRVLQIFVSTNTRKGC